MRANDVEREASLFALFLLMPKDLLLKEIDKLGGLDYADDTKMKSLCKTFDVSMTALAVRISYLKFKP